MLFLDLDLTDVAGVLDDLGDVRLVLAADLSGDPLGEVDEATVHPVLPKDTNSRRADGDAEGGEVRLDHAESAVDGPENKEDDEQVVRVPEALEIGAARLFDRGGYHGHECSEHHVAGPARSCNKVGKQPAFEAEVVLCRQLSEIVPVGNRVDPGEEDNGPRYGLVESDVLVELYDAIQRGLAGQRDERAADGEQNHCNVEVKSQRRCSGNGICDAECRSCARQVIFDLVIHESKGEDHSVDEGEHGDEAAKYQYEAFLIKLPQCSQSTVTLVDHPPVESLPPIQFLRLLTTHLS